MEIIRVSVFTCLGVCIYITPSDSVLLNIEPLYVLIKARTHMWAKLPLGVSQLNLNDAPAQNSVCPMAFPGILTVETF